jgi:hypothetical protein
MIAWLLASAAFGHGGPPRSDALMWDSSGDMIVSSSHGLIFEDEGYSWVCDEVLGSAVPTEVIQSRDVLLTRSTQGVAFSKNGCDWTWSGGIDGLVVWDIATDIEDPEIVWSATEAGLWRSEDAGETFTPAGTPDPAASVRSFVQMPDMSWTVLGFVGGEPTAWLGSTDDWLSVALPTEGGHLIALGSDDSGHAYARLPMASGTDRLVRLSPDGEVATLLETETSIDAFLSVDGSLLVSIQGMGLHVSTDLGQTWQTRGTEPTRCLTVHDGQLYGCPDDPRRLMWSSTALDLLTEATDWTPGLGFDQVSGPRCDTLLTCDMVWPQVQRELGLVVATDTGDTGEPSSAPSDVHCGCSHGAAVVLLPWGVLWARRRTEGSS